MCCCQLQVYLYVSEAPPPFFLSLHSTTSFSPKTHSLELLFIATTRRWWKEPLKIAGHHLIQYIYLALYFILLHCLLAATYLIQFFLSRGQISLFGPSGTLVDESAGECSCEQINGKKVSLRSDGITRYRMSVWITLRYGGRKCRCQVINDIFAF